MATRGRGERQLLSSVPRRPRDPEKMCKQEGDGGNGKKLRLGGNFKDGKGTEMQAGMMK